MDKMFPQSELDNYKLQVELLQEKLQRSEENRNQLEHKLEQILQKRSEHDKSMRSKTRQKYQQFLDEQQKRNERNKLLVQMLERIDEQTSAMSARSERLKMMKLQYEMYFAKLVQAQTMRCIQNNAMAATTIPVLLQTPAAAAAVATSTPLKGTEQTTATLAPAPAATTYQIDSSLLPTTYSSGNLYQLCSSNLNEMLPKPRQWTLALATPAPTAMYTMTAAPAAAATATRAPTLQDLDYLKYPIGYLPPSMQFAYQQQQQHQYQRPDAVDMLSTNRYNNNARNDRQHGATLDEIADINDSITSKQTPQRSHITTATKAFEKISSTEDYDDNNNSSNHAAELFEAMKSSENTISRRAAAAVPATMLSTTTTPTSTPTATSIFLPMMTETSTALTFDKLSTHNGKSKTWQSTDDNVATERAAVTTTAAAVKEAAGLAAGAKLPKAAEFLNYNKNAAALPNPSDFANVNNSNAPSGNPNNNSKYYDAEKLAAVNRDADDADDANLMRRHKIDETWSTTTTTPVPTTSMNIGKDNDFATDNANNALLAGDKRFEPKNNRNSFDTELMPPSQSTANSYQPPQFARKEKMSIENIENTFYGELVKPVAADAVLATTESNKQAALSATNGLLEELASGGETTKDSSAVEVLTAQDEPQQAVYDYGSQPVAEPLTSYANDNQSNFAQSAETDYAALDGGITTTDNYASEAEAQQYQQYDPTQTAGQEYDPNLDYQNYDAAAYQAAYDPNAYPGYTYDETTGQYTANDENQQYAEQEAAYGEAAYMQQDYNEAAMQQEQQQEALAGNYEDYSQYQQQQQQQQDVLTSVAAAQPTTNEYNAPPTAESPALFSQATASKIDPPNTEPSTTSTTPATTPAPATAPIKPILSTEKFAANEAQQKRKKRVNFVDSSETDESSSVKPDGAAGAAGAVGGDGAAGAGSSESDFDFSSSGGATNN